MSGDGDILAAIGRLDSRLAGLELKLDSSVQKLEAGQDRLEATVTRLRVDVMQRIDRLQEKATQLSDESVVNYASSSTIGKKLRSYEDQNRDVADQLAAMFRMIKRFDERLNALEDKS